MEELVIFAKKSEDMRIGILGGGQLGRMMFQETIGLNLDLWFMDHSLETPVGYIAKNFFVGDFTNYDDVIAFAEDKDVISIEIEKVNLAALKEIEKQGKIVHPNTNALEIIQDKGLQKTFYRDQDLPTSDFFLVDDKSEIEDRIHSNTLAYPFVQKARKDGYDGQGVAIIKSSDDINRLMDVPSVIEPLVDIEKELAVIAVKNADGAIFLYPCAEMVFDPVANLVQYLYAPAEIPLAIENQCNEIAKELIDSMGICGLLAVEYFYTKNGKVLINEVAPRPHNSGHHTLDAMVCSQFENHIRGIANLPLGSTEQYMPAAMINVLGEPGYTGEAKPERLDIVLETDNAHLHLYGKKITKPMRKMGHITVLGKDRETVEKKINTIQSTFKIIA